MLKHVVRLVVRVLGGLILFGLAEFFRRLSFTAPDELLATGIVAVAAGLFAGGFWTILEAARSFWRARRDEDARRQARRDRTFGMWSSLAKRR